MISSAVCGLTMLPFRTAAAPAAATATAAGSVWLSVPLGDPDGDVSPPRWFVQVRRHKRSVRLLVCALVTGRWSGFPGLGPGAPVGVRPLSRGRFASADLLGQGDDDARGAVEVAQQEDALVLCHLAEESGAVGAQAGDGIMDVVDGEDDAVQGDTR